MYCTIKTAAASVVQHRQQASSSRAVPTLFLLAFLSSSAKASPLQVGIHDAIERRAGPDDQATMAPKIWIPVLVAAIVLLSIAVLSWTKGSFRKALGLFGLQGVPGEGAGPRELTAEQLAGTINGDSQTPTSGAPARTRRTRRPRRTPSQISTISLPAYNKEPGAEEVVVFRGRDPEDATTMPAATVMDSVDEDQDEALGSYDNSQASRYSPMPAESGNNIPLLRSHSNDTSADLSLESMQSPDDDMPRRSQDRSSQDTSSLRRTDSNLPDSNLPDSRGEAPPYFEVVDSPPQPNLVRPVSSGGTTLPAATPESAASSPPLQVHPHRPSGFRNLLNRMSIVVHPHPSHQHLNNSHHRADSNASALSAGSPPLSPSHPRSYPSAHRTNPSSSSLLPSPSVTNLFRTISGQRSSHTLASQRLNSPSMISLNSISAPLSHTLVRTEFTYPKSGPTPEQLKVISSRDSVGKFGMPYGEDAVRYASQPLPDFTSAVGSGSILTTNVATHDRSRSATSFSRLHSEVTADEVNNTTSGGGEVSLAPESSSVAPANGEEEPGSGSNDTPPSSISKGTNPALESSSTTRSRHNSYPPASASPTSASPATQTSTQSTSEFGALSAAPSSFVLHGSVSSGRSESRASAYSHQSYATAAESIPASPMGTMRSTFDYENEVGSEPNTPRRDLHASEQSNATIVP